MAAESAVQPNRDELCRELQRSRGVMAAERSSSRLTAAHRISLQRSRGVMAAERVAYRNSRTNCALLQRSRGVMAAESAARTVAEMIGLTASTEPRRDGRGEWCAGQTPAHVIAASTEPRRDGRGEVFDRLEHV